MAFRSIYPILPVSIRELIQSLPRTVQGCLEEIRVRQNRPLEVITAEQSWFVSHGCQLSSCPKDAVIPGEEDCRKILNLVTKHSLYTMEEELRRGYVTIEGGHRVGIVGRVVVDQAKVKYIRDVTSFNIRIARQVKGVAERLLPYLIHENRLENVLIVSPPQCGKTTLIRDLARLASLGGKDYPSYKVGIVDERSEIAGCINGVPQHDVGPRTDVLDACPKAEGMMMMIRSMSPEILVADEIGRKEDSEAVHEAIYAGVHIFATAHGRSIEDIVGRPTLASLVKDKVFTRILLLSRNKGPGTVEMIYNQHLQPIELPRFSPQVVPVR